MSLLSYYLVTCIDIVFSNWWRRSDGTRLTLITTLPLHMELALNTWKSQLSRAGTGNSDVLNLWHWASWAWGTKPIVTCYVPQNERPIPRNTKNFSSWSRSIKMDWLCEAKPFHYKGLALRSKANPIIMERLKPIQQNWSALLCKVDRLQWFGFAKQS